MFLPIRTVSGENLDRMVRMFARFTSIGYVVYVLLLASAISNWSARMDSWWTPTAAVTVFGFGLLPGLFSFTSDIRYTRTAGAVAAVFFLIAVATWPIAWNGEQVELSDGVWLAAFPGLASIAAVIAWPAWLAFAHMVIGCVGVQYLNLVARDGAEPSSMLPETAFAVMFCSLFVGGSVMALRTARLLDATTDQTHAAAAAAAGQRARTVERARFDALTHDGVMATLLVASRSAAPETISPLARSTLAELDEIRTGARTDRPFHVEQAVVHLRAAAADAADRADFTVDVAEAAQRDEMPAEAVWTLGAAVSEALRNSVRHAGPDAATRINVDVDPEGLRIVVSDDGVGFDPHSVAPHRLGVAVSIHARMRSLDGGSSRIVSGPGKGTVVELGWRR